MPPAPRSDQPDDRPLARHAGPMFEDIASEMLWPRVLRAPALAIRPTRVMLGTAAALIASIIGSIPLHNTDQPTIAREASVRLAHAFESITDALLALNPNAFAHAVTRLALLPGTLIQDRPWETVFLAVPMVIAFALFGGAIARSAADEFATARVADWTELLRISLRHLGSSTGALLAPLALAGAAVLLIASAGVLLGIPILDVVASLLYAIALGLALLAILILVLHALSLPMIVPALMTEGTDAFDAVQRCYAYVIGRPLHLLAHAALLLVLGAVSIGLFAVIARGSDQMATWAAQQFTAEAGIEVLTGDGELTATQPAAHSIVSLFRSLIDLLVSGFAISYFFTAGAVLYLVARRLCDGQDVADLWSPKAH